MDKSTLWSLRLGFSSKDSIKIENAGIDTFLKNAFNSEIDSVLPSFLKDDPKTVKEIREYRK